MSELQTSLAVHNIPDLIGLVPYLIGFYPRESLVIMVIEDGHVRVTARADLADLAEPAQLAGLLGRLFERFPAAEGWFIAYTDQDELAWRVLPGCEFLVGATRVGRLLQVGAHQWRSDHGDGPTGLIDPEVSATAAAAAVMGLSARGSREALAELVAGPPDADIDDLVARTATEEPALTRLGDRGRRRLLARLLRTAVPSTADRVRLALLVERPEGQVRVLEMLTTDNAEQQLALWTSVVRHSLIALQPGPLGLMGMAAWLTGDGALQMVCLERLDRIDPAAPIAALLDWINYEVVPPNEWAAQKAVLIGAVADYFTAAGPPASQPHR